MLCCCVAFILYYTILYYSIVLCSTVLCRTLWCCTVRFSIVLCKTVCRSTVLCCTVWCTIVWCSTVWLFTVLCSTVCCSTGATLRSKKYGFNNLVFSNPWIQHSLDSTISYSTIIECPLDPTILGFNDLEFKYPHTPSSLALVQCSAVV